jgi:hypothetical protein
LDVKESTEIDVVFKPNSTGRFANSFIVECKGVSYKEIVVVGIGGQMKLEISPKSVDLGEFVYFAKSKENFNEHMRHRSKSV